MIEPAMPQTITIQLLNDQALLLLQALEQMQMLRVLPAAPAKHRWAGSIASEVAQDMLKALNQSREQWERNI